MAFFFSLLLILNYFSIQKISVMSLMVKFPTTHIFCQGQLGRAFLSSIISKREMSSALHASLLPSFESKTNDASDESFIKKGTDIDKPRVIFVLGGPGAGKGTQCAKLSADLGMVHLSAGELLRAERASGSSNGLLIDSYIKEGKIVPVQITLNCLRRAMESAGSHRFLIDGFPRNWDNVQGWMDHMPSVCNIESVVFIDCPEDELERRLLQRGVTSGRTDDNIESARKRFNTYNVETMPIVLHYEKAGKLLRVSGAQSVDAVYADLRKAIEPYIVQDLLERSQEL